MRIRLLLAICFPLLASILSAQGKAVREITIATKVTPPFVTRDGDHYSGLSIELWDLLSKKLDMRATFVERDLEGMLAAAEKGEVDLALAAITVTPEREAVMDFSHPFLSSGLGIATRGQDQGLMAALADRLFSFELLQALGALAFVLAGCGLLLWLVERRANPDQFGGKGLRGPGAGLWFSAVTMTTVGYGDKAPITPAGRVITLVWMFASVIVISGYTAAIASALTVDRLQSVVRGPEDLPNARVGTLRGSAAAQWLDQRNVRYTAYRDVGDAIASLDQKHLDAIVYDAPILKSYVLDRPELLVLPDQLRSEQYAIAMPRGSTLRKELNGALLEVLQSDVWHAVRRRYLGD
ncbi:MAG: transporter substrate-binding domain-containing protein [Planctomycetes bacterium]|nr:transporter substrate-binding domain-containing protein [Planctomycetota bacterium]